jgi:protein phosphatase/serine/threonine-protein phosphatase Stp1
MAEPLEGLAERLVARAVAAGGRDDITAIVARLSR